MAMARHVAVMDDRRPGNPGKKDPMISLPPFHTKTDWQSGKMTALDKRVSMNISR
jgi:hypothetical protein